MSVQQVDTAFHLRTKNLSGHTSAEMFATFIAHLMEYSNSFEIHEFSFKISFRTIWINVDEANRHVAQFIAKVWKALGETFDVTEDQVQIEYQIDGRDLSKEAIQLLVRTSAISEPMALEQLRITHPFGS